MAYFNTCNRCGANLDPGEKCDCIYNHKEEKRQPKKAGARKEVKR